MNYLHIPYEFINNDEGELMLVFAKPEDWAAADDENAQLVYDGSKEAMLVRNSEQTIHIPVIEQVARELLGTIEKLLVTEMDGDDIDDVYEAEVKIVNPPLPIH